VHFATIGASLGGIQADAMRSLQLLCGCSICPLLVLVVWIAGPHVHFATIGASLGGFQAGAMGSLHEAFRGPTARFSCWLVAACDREFVSIVGGKLQLEWLGVVVLRDQVVSLDQMVQGFDQLISVFLVVASVFFFGQSTPQSG